MATLELVLDTRQAQAQIDKLKAEVESLRDTLDAPLPDLKVPDLSNTAHQLDAVGDSGKKMFAAFQNTGAVDEAASSMSKLGSLGADIGQAFTNVGEMAMAAGAAINSFAKEIVVAAIGLASFAVVIGVAAVAAVGAFAG